MPSSVESNYISTKWSSSISEDFNIITLGKLFKSQQTLIVAGCQDGVLRTYELPIACHNKPACLPADFKLTNISTYETKGGPIQCMCIHDVTKFYGNDLILGDSRGVVTLFSNQQIFSRKALSKNSLKDILVQKDALGNLSIVCCDVEGHLVAFSPYRDEWHLRLADMKTSKNSLSAPSVQCLFSCLLTDSYGNTSDYILASDNSKKLYIIHQGSVVMVLQAPSVITAMCAGNFIAKDELEVTGEQEEDDRCKQVKAQQVALGSNSGAIYILDSFQIYRDEYVNIQLPIKKLVKLPSQNPDSCDMLVCAGDFNAVCLIKQGEMMAKHVTSSWVNSVIPLNDENNDKFIIGCDDKTIHQLNVLNAV